MARSLVFRSAIRHVLASSSPCFASLRFLSLLIGVRLAPAAARFVALQHKRRARHSRRPSSSGAAAIIIIIAATSSSPFPYCLLLLVGFFFLLSSALHSSVLSVLSLMIPFSALLLPLQLPCHHSSLLLLLCVRLLYFQLYGFMLIL